MTATTTDPQPESGDAPRGDLPSLLARVPAVASLLIGGALGLFVGVREGTPPALAAAIGLGGAFLIYLAWIRRDLRRRRLASLPFPEAWRVILDKWVDFYRGLDAPARRRFEREVQYFLDEQTITGPRGRPLTDELRLLVAASAVVVIFGKVGFRYPRLRDIIVYDEAFDDEYRVGPEGDILGMVHGQGPILFSAQSLREGFRGEHDGRNVGYHEFAHVLDFEYGRADGVPTFMPWGIVGPWLELVHEETAKVQSRRHLLREYAATNEAEFFAVATEVFFERPTRLKRKHPRLYALLSETYGQDPARDHAEEPPLEAAEEWPRAPRTAGQRDH